jgi:hypothetical protein
VHFVKPNTLHCTGLSVGKDHGLADKLSLRLLELAEDVDARRFTVGMGDPELAFERVGICI